MANIKSVVINGEIPYDFIERLNADDAVFFARMFSGPSISMTISYSAGPIRYEPTGKGNGQLAIYGFAIDGQEAYGFRAFDRLADVIENGDGRILSGTAVDIEGGTNDTWTYQTPAKAAA